ncbi:AcrR family transcriptional regulator [Amycolatopsis jiangsuensis]|uniref:AcrR family transcriptional regulator n=2 Tax=Amycolatopsis jiangsuensis TaxID=1181879 RepID=A0A840ILG7_9PSEU|nr:AcrR family transcriptional regulator [Amycolatopsis jiangsuensis]
MGMDTGSSAGEPAIGSAHQVEHLRADSRTSRPGGRTARVGQAVLDATIAELSEVGYAALRIESVAERAGVNKTTIYRRWGDKAGLVATAFIDRRDEFAPPPDTGSLRGDLLIHLREIRDTFQTPWLTRLVQELGPRTEERSDVREVLDQIWSVRLELSRMIFVRGIERGELPAGADPGFLIEATSGPLYFRWLLLGRELDDEFLARTADLVLAGAGAAKAD